MKHRKLLKRNKGKYWRDRQNTKEQSSLGAPQTNGLLGIKATQQGSIKNR
jgi:hypothetical protein